MGRQLKVYGGTSFHAYKNGGYIQGRYIVAAHSVAEVLRIAGIKRSEYAWTDSETGNTEEVKLATATPGRLYFAPLYSRSVEDFIDVTSETR